MNTPTGNRPENQHPARGSSLGAWVQPGFSRRKIDSEQSTEIREKFRAAREENPDIPKAVFARTVAPDYGVSAATIVKIITNV